MKVEYRIGGTYSLEYVVDAICNYEKRPEWDSHIVKGKLLNQYSRNVSIYTYVMKNKKMFEDDREFIERQVVFTDGDAVYIYITSANDSFAPVNPNCVRAKTVVSVWKIQREGDEILMISSQQSDLKLPSLTTETYSHLADQIETMKQELESYLEKISQY